MALPCFRGACRPPGHSVSRKSTCPGVKPGEGLLRVETRVSEGIPEDVQQFIFEHIDAIEQLDVLLLLRSTPTREWSAREVSDELRANPASITDRLASLAGLNLLVESGSTPPLYRFAPKEAAVAAVIDKLAEVYRVRRHKVFELIFSPIKRARSFARAFLVVRGPKKDEDDHG